MKSVLNIPLSHLRKNLWGQSSSLAQMDYKPQVI